MLVLVLGQQSLLICILLDYKVDQSHLTLHLAVSSAWRARLSCIRQQKQLTNDRVCDCLGRCLMVRCVRIALLCHVAKAV